jgi:hypothetical protein
MRPSQTEPLSSRLSGRSRTVFVPPFGRLAINLDFVS